MDTTSSDQVTFENFSARYFRQIFPETVRGPRLTITSIMCKLDMSTKKETGVPLEMFVKPKCTTVRVQQTAFYLS